MEWNCALQGKDTQVFVKRFEELFAEALVLSEEVLEDYRKRWTKLPISFPSRDSSQEDSTIPPVMCKSKRFMRSKRGEKMEAKKA